jgi:hypothetical protein
VLDCVDGLVVVRVLDCVDSLVVVRVLDSGEGARLC